MQRTPESIAISRQALDIGLSMLELLVPKANSYDICRSGLASLEQWIDGKTTVADCRRSSSKVHESARDCHDPIQRNAMRAIGHAIATAHVSTHLKACNDYAKKTLAQAKNKLA